MRLTIIAHLTDYPATDSSARRVEAFARGLSEKGHDVTVLIPIKRRSGDMTTKVEGVKVRWLKRCVKQTPKIDMLISHLYLIIWVLMAILQKKTDWLLLYNLNIDGIGSVLLARLCGGRVAGIIDDIRDTQARGLKLWVLKLADNWVTRFGHLNIVISTYLARRAKQIAPNTPYIIVPPLVNVAQFEEDQRAGQQFRQQYGISDTMLVGYFGHLYFNQGIANLLEAIKKVRAEGVNLEVLIAGASISEIQCDNVEEISHHLQIQNIVHQVGWLSTEQVIPAMSACDILAIPRIPHLVNEAGSPTKLAEYLSMGKPIIAAGVGDIPLYHQQENAFLLTEPGVVDSLVNAMKMLAEKPTLRQELGQSARGFAERYFDYRLAIEPLHQLISSLPHHSVQKHSNTIAEKDISPISHQ